MRVTILTAFAILLASTGSIAAQTGPIQTSISDSGPSVRRANFLQAATQVPDDAANAVPLFQGGFETPPQPPSPDLPAAESPAATPAAATPAAPQYTEPQYVVPQNTAPQYTAPQNSEPQYTEPQYVEPRYTPQQTAPQYIPQPPTMLHDPQHSIQEPAIISIPEMQSSPQTEPLQIAPTQPTPYVEPAPAATTILPHAVIQPAPVRQRGIVVDRAPTCEAGGNCDCPSCGVEPSCDLGIGCGVESVGLCEAACGVEPSCGCGSATCGLGSGCADAPFGGGLMGGQNNLLDMIGAADGIWFAGVGLYYVQPVWETNPSMALTSGGGAQNTSRPFDWELQIAPLAFAGYTGNNGLGWQARYAFLDANVQDSYTPPAGEGAFTPTVFRQNLFAGAGQTLSTSHELDFQFVDLELTQERRVGGAGLKGTFGGRYLTLDQRYSAIVNNGANQSLISQHGFKGFGPTVSVEVARHLGDWKLFGNFRQSVLIGDRDSRVDVNFGVIPGSRVENDLGVVSMSEVEAGVRRDFDLGLAMPFIEAAVVGQYWSGVGNAANGGLYTQQRDQAMGLFGGRASIGLTY